MQPRICALCWKTFSNSFNLKQHVVNVHTVGEGLQCHLCHKKVKNKWYLRKHHVTAHGAPLKRGKHASQQGGFGRASESVELQGFGSGQSSESQPLREGNLYPGEGSEESVDAFYHVSNIEVEHSRPSVGPTMPPYLHPGSSHHFNMSEN